MVLTFDFNLQIFIINASLLCVAITIALYTLVSPKFEEILKRQGKQLEEAYNELRRINEAFSKKVEKRESDKKLLDALQLQSEKFEQYKKIPFHLGIGFLICGVLFSLSTIFPLIDIFFYDMFITAITVISPYFLIVGIIILLYIWFKVIFNIKDSLKETYIDAIDHSSLNPASREGDKKWVRKNPDQILQKLGK